MKRKTHEYYPLATSALCPGWCLYVARGGRVLLAVVRPTSPSSIHTSILLRFGRMPRAQPRVGSSYGSSAGTIIIGKSEGILATAVNQLCSSISLCAEAGDTNGETMTRVRMQKGLCLSQSPDSPPKLDKDELLRTGKSMVEVTLCVILSFSKTIIPAEHMGD